MRSLSDLITFLNTKMSMTDVYQPAIILYLLEHGGTATVSELAVVLSGYDTTVQEYYQKIVMRWPRITLAKHDIIQYLRPSSQFKLQFILDDPDMIQQAKSICEEKIRTWIEKKATRSKPQQKEPSIRYRVLKAARGRCELCGIPSKFAPIDVDHIIPRSRADRDGFILKDNVRMHVDDERNLQALCFRCNRAKRDQDDTDFRLPTRKLVRDRIPDEIRKGGGVPITSVVTGKAFSESLYAKLWEEHAELISANESTTDRSQRILDEIADMIEVLLSIAKVAGHDEAQTIKILHDKRARKGDFSKGIILEAVSKTT